MLRQWCNASLACLVAPKWRSAMALITIAIKLCDYRSNTKRTSVEATLVLCENSAQAARLSRSYRSFPAKSEMTRVNKRTLYSNRRWRCSYNAFFFALSLSSLLLFLLLLLLPLLYVIRNYDTGTSKISRSVFQRDAYCRNFYAVARTSFALAVCLALSCTWANFYASRWASCKCPLCALSDMRSRRPYTWDGAFCNKWSRSFSASSCCFRRECS